MIRRLRQPSNPISLRQIALVRLDVSATKNTVASVSATFVVPLLKEPIALADYARLALGTTAIGGGTGIAGAEAGSSVSTATQRLFDAGAEAILDFAQ